MSARSLYQSFRARSPFGGRSILITSAPSQARVCVHAGPAWSCVKSMTRMPSRALLIGSSSPSALPPGRPAHELRHLCQPHLGQVEIAARIAPDAVGAGVDGAAALAEREHHLPVRRELQDLVLVTVTDKDVVVRRDVDAVGIAQAAVAPAREEVPVGVEDEDRGILPLVEVDAIA